GDDIVAVTHDCDYPEAARALPRVTRSTIAAGTSSRDIDTAVRVAAAAGDSTFHVDAAALADARPDILLGQTLCQVCAVTVSQLPAVMDPSPEIVPLDGDSIAGIFDDIERVGEAIGRARGIGCPHGRRALVTTPRGTSDPRVHARWERVLQPTRPARGGRYRAAGVAAPRSSRLVQLTASSCRVPSMPLSSCVPRSANAS